MAITTKESFYILQFNRDAFNAAVEQGASIGDEGVEEAFEVVAEIPEEYVFMLHQRAIIYANQSLKGENLQMGRGLLHIHQCSKSSELPHWHRNPNGDTLRQVSTENILASVPCVLKQDF